MTKFASSVLLAFFALAVCPALNAAPGEPILLWPEGAPGALGTNAQDIPKITPYLPDPAKRNGATMLILPGGGYRNLAGHEGAPFAEWLAGEGVTCYVLQYRLGTHGYRHPRMLQDAARALRMLRSFAKRDGLDPDRIGIMGSSAGGHLAATLLTHFDAGQPGAADPYERESSRPDLGVLCYPVITMGELSHNGSRASLLGENPSPELIADLSTELKVTAETPPTFIWHTVEDATVPVENALLFASALRRAGVPFALHVYEKGTHGLALGRPNRPAPPWAENCLYWLGERGFLR